jgi:hypothetical protein
MPRPARGLTRFWLEDRSLVALLAFITVNIFIVGPLRQLDVLDHLAVGLVFGLLLLSGVAAVARSTTVAAFFGVVVVLTQAVHWSSWLTGDPRWRMPDALASFIATGLLATLVLVQVFREGPITLGRLCGAIAVYLLLGLMFAFLYTALAFLIPGAFSVTLTMHPRTAVAPEFVYFSFVTLSTVGYGDIEPVHPVARSLATLEAICGQLFPAVLLARLVSLELYYRQRRFEREQASLDRQAIAREIARHLKDDARS